MPRSILTVLRLSCIACVAITSANATAQTVSQVYGDALTKQTQTVFIRADMNYTTYQSKAAGSNTSATTSSYAIGGYVGEKRALGFFMTSDDQDVKFELSNGRITNSWNDIHMQARFGWFYPQVVVSMHEMTVDRDGTRVLDSYGNGIGGGLGLFLPVTNSMVVHADGYIVKNSKNRNNTANDVEIGDRVDVDIGASVDVIQHYIDFLIGYKVRTFKLIIDDQTYNEQQSAPYIGIQLGAYF